MDLIFSFSFFFLNLELIFKEKSSVNVSVANNCQSCLVGIKMSNNVCKLSAFLAW